MSKTLPSRYSLSHRVAPQLPFFYGYVMILVATLIQIASSPGQTFAISAFTPHLGESLSLSNFQLTLAYMLGTFCAAIPLSTIGPLTDRLGLKWITLSVIIGLCATCFFASQAAGFYSLFFSFFLLRFLGQGSLSLLSGNSIAMWYRTKMGRVSAVMSVGTAIAFAWVPTWINDSVLEFGWRFTFQRIAFVVAVVMLPVVFLLFRDRPEDVGQCVDGAQDNSALDNAYEEKSGSKDQSKDSRLEVSFTMSQALRTKSFFVLAATNLMWALTGTGVTFYLFVFCADQGIDSVTAGNLFKTFGLCMLLLQLIGGILADFLPLNQLLGMGMMMLAAGLGAICFGQGIGALKCFSALFGGGQGLLLAVGAVIWVRFYGRKHLGAIRGTVWSCTVAGSGFGPLLMGFSRDLSGGFEAAITGFFAVISLLAAASWWVTAPQSQVLE